MREAARNSACYTLLCRGNGAEAPKGRAGAAQRCWEKPEKATMPLASSQARVRLQAALRLSPEHWKEAPLHEGGEGNCTGNSGCKLTAAGTHHSSYHTTIVPLDKNNPQGLQPCGAGAGACCLEGWNVTRLQPGSCSLALCYTFIS